jgi:hypothetical protein
MKASFAAAGACAALVVLVGCSDGRDAADRQSSIVPSTTASRSAVVTTSSSPPPTTAAAPIVPSTAETVEEYVEPVPVYEEPYIVECQRGGGLGPIVTSWSDGTETGWSEYCQSVHDQALQSEVDANTPVCETSVCVYPNGVTRPNPDYRVVETPSPWVQGQIDWQNCLDAGNTEEFCRATLN